MGSIEYDLREYEHQEAMADMKYHRLLPEIEAEAEAAAEEMLKDDDWWNDQLEGVNAITGALPLILADVMRNLDAACADNALAQRAILAALSRLQKTASLEAYDQAFPQAEKEICRA